MSDIRTLRLTDEGIEVPESLRGFTGQLHVETPSVDMTATIVTPGLGETSMVMPCMPDGETPAIPADHIRMAGELYQVVDDREEVRQ